MRRSTFWIRSLLLALNGLGALALAAWYARHAWRPEAEPLEGRILAPRELEARGAGPALEESPVERVSPFGGLGRGRAAPVPEGGPESPRPPPPEAPPVEGGPLAALLEYTSGIFRDGDPERSRLLLRVNGSAPRAMGRDRGPARGAASISLRAGERRFRDQALGLDFEVHAADREKLVYSLPADPLRLYTLRRAVTPNLWIVAARGQALLPVGCATAQDGPEE